MSLFLIKRGGAYEGGGAYYGEYGIQNLFTIYIHIISYKMDIIFHDLSIS